MLSYWGPWTYFQNWPIVSKLTCPLNMTLLLSDEGRYSATVRCLVVTFAFATGKDRCLLAQKNTERFCVWWNSESVINGGNPEIEQTTRNRAQGMVRGRRWKHIWRGNFVHASFPASQRPDARLEERKRSRPCWKQFDPTTLFSSLFDRLVFILFYFICVVFFAIWQLYFFSFITFWNSILAIQLRKSKRLTLHLDEKTRLLRRYSTLQPGKSFLNCLKKKVNETAFAACQQHSIPARRKCWAKSAG